MCSNNKSQKITVIAFFYDYLYLIYSHFFYFTISSSIEKLSSSTLKNKIKLKIFGKMVENKYNSCFKKHILDDFKNGILQKERPFYKVQCP